MGKNNAMKDREEAPRDAEAVRDARLESGARATRGTRVSRLVFIVLVMALLLVPFVGMVWARTDSTVENRALAVIPSLIGEDGGVNSAYLSDLGTWFEDHFAYRNQAVSLNALIRAELFGVSTSDQVVVGSDGWLYYGGTIDDYVGASPLTERELRAIAHNLYLMQTYTEAQGAKFAFTIAPNKNTLYPEHMPVRSVPAPDPSNAERLVFYLEEYGVNYVDLFAVLGEAAADTPEPLYLLRDSHWNNRGASLASTALAEELGIGSTPLGEWVERVDSTGDLDLMLLPALATPEPQSYLVGVNDQTGFSGSDWRYVSDARDVEADLSQTEGGATDTLITYRDSFGNALLPYLATQTETAEFSKLVPYNALRIADLKANCVLVERAERHIDYLAQSAPIMPCPAVRLDTDEARPDVVAQAQSTCEVGRNGPLVSFSGVIDPRVVEDDSVIYVSVRQAEGAGGSTVAVSGADTDASSASGSVASGADDSAASAAAASAASAAAASGERVFEAFMLSPSGSREGNGYVAYVPETALPEGESEIKVFIARRDGLFLVQSVVHHSQ
jgi:hypothetical protein